jgi:hypothetical protein
MATFLLPYVMSILYHIGGETRSPCVGSCLNAVQSSGPAASHIIAAILSVSEILNAESNPPQASAARAGQPARRPAIRSP